MIFAQAMAEYGAIAGMIAGAERALYSASAWVEDISPSTWAVVGTIVLLVMLMRRRNPRL